jgi:hypothetical protein
MYKPFMKLLLHDVGLETEHSKNSTIFIRLCRWDLALVEQRAARNGDDLNFCFRLGESFQHAPWLVSVVAYDSTRKFTDQFRIYIYSVRTCNVSFGCNTCNTKGRVQRLSYISYIRLQRLQSPTTSCVRNALETCPP